MQDSRAQVWANLMCRRLQQALLGSSTAGAAPRGPPLIEPMAGKQDKKEKVAKKPQKSGRYKKGARKNRTDKYTPKSELTRMKDTEVRLQAEVSSLSKRVKILEEELLAERNERLSLEATLEAYQGRNRRGRRDLVHG